jgi:hypothetical protein
MISLNEDNFVLYAAANYKTAVYDMKEFQEDLNTITYLKRLFSRYADRGELKERLILNHLILLYNIFKSDAVTKMLFLRIEERHWKYLKTFLLFLSYMPDVVYGIDGRNIISSEIEVDITITKKLREL